LSGATKVITGVKYAYLLAFFALLSGLFYPLIQGGTEDFVILGVIMLIIGLAGGILVYKATTSAKRRGIYLAGGFGLMLFSLFYILQITGRQLI
jgi:uncharacterized membrane protein YjjP (DUF1212 family)